MMAEEKLRAARAYIEAGDYGRAKAILETMPDSHTAQRWLRRIADRIPPETQAQTIIAMQPLSSSETTPEPMTQLALKKPTEKPRQRWEYCALGVIEHAQVDDGTATEEAALIEFSPSGDHLVENHLQLATTIAQLGDEGWEMVSTGVVPVLKALAGANLDYVFYFKRLA